MMKEKWRFDDLKKNSSPSSVPSTTSLISKGSCRFLSCSKQQDQPLRRSRRSRRDEDPSQQQPWRRNQLQPIMILIQCDNDCSDKDDKATASKMILCKWLPSFDFDRDSKNNVLSYDESVMIILKDAVVNNHNTTSDYCNGRKDALSVAACCPASLAKPASAPKRMPAHGLAARSRFAHRP